MASDRPLEVALIGAGNRASTTYGAILPHLQEWVRVVAVCDPVVEHSEQLAARLGARPFHSIQDLVAAELVEAALVVTPIPSHHSISAFLSVHGIHHEVETAMADTLEQARDMVARAAAGGVVLRVGENFFRVPFDRMMKLVAQSGVIGDVRRVLCMYDHTGFHNNSRWIAFHEAAALTVQAIHHDMPVAPHHSMPHRHHTSEAFRCYTYTFPGDRLVVDLAGNIKGNLGRHPRPGYTEVAGARGVVVQQAVELWAGRAEVRRCTDDALRDGGKADQIAAIVDEVEDDVWTRSHVAIDGRRFEYVNPLRVPASHFLTYYGATVAGHVVDFARAVWRARGSQSAAQDLAAQGFEYTDREALAAMEMWIGADESALRDGAKLSLPLEGEIQADREVSEHLQRDLGAHPMDVEAMLGIAYPRT